MGDDQRKGGSDWIEWVAGLASLLGMSRVRVRWKLDRWRRDVWGVGGKAAKRVEHIRYQHKVCGVCGRLHDKEDKVCTGCGARLGGAAWQKVQRVGLVMPQTMTISMALVLVILVAYVRMIVTQASGPDAAFSLWSLFSIDTWTVVAHGGLYPPALKGGEYWRIATPIFLHFGLIHLGFNLFALTQVGPSIEEIYGRTRTLLLFVLTGLIANLVSLPFIWGGVSAGASGALMGLIGVAAAWGHRDGTTQGRLVRNRMLKWAVYIVIFGFFIRANNAAHIGGFLAGGALAWFVPAGWPKDPTGKQIALGLELGFGAVALLALALVLVPPQRSLQWAAAPEEPPPMDAAAWSAAQHGKGGVHAELDDPTLRVMVPICDDWRSGRRGPAIGAYRKAFGVEPGEVDVLLVLEKTCPSVPPPAEEAAADDDSAWRDDDSAQDDDDSARRSGAPDDDDPAAPAPDTAPYQPTFSWEK